MLIMKNDQIIIFIVRIDIGIDSMLGVDRVCSSDHAF